jgi:hypothetical protein
MAKSKVERALQQLCYVHWDPTFLREVVYIQKEGEKDSPLLFILGSS